MQITFSAFLQWLCHVIMKYAISEKSNDNTERIGSEFSVIEFKVVKIFCQDWDKMKFTSRTFFLKWGLDYEKQLKCSSRAISEHNIKYNLAGN